MRLIRGTRLFSKNFVVAGLQGSRFQLAQTLDLDRECFLQWSCFLLTAIPSSLPWTLSYRQKASWRTGSLQHHRWSSQPLLPLRSMIRVRRRSFDLTPNQSNGARGLLSMASAFE